MGKLAVQRRVNGTTLSLSLHELCQDPDRGIFWICWGRIEKGIDLNAIYAASKQNVSRGSIQSTLFVGDDFRVHQMRPDQTDFPN